MSRHGITRRQLPRGQAGFTILEVMVAVVIFAVGLAAIAGMQTRSIQQSTFSDQISIRVNAATHWAESLTGLPVKEDEVGIDTDNLIDVKIDPSFNEENMCEYGESCDGYGDKSEYCGNDGWDEVDYNTDKSPHALCQRITQGYPLPNLVMIEVEAIPKGDTEYKTKQRTVRIAYIRSRRWN